MLYFFVFFLLTDRAILLITGLEKDFFSSVSSPMRIAKGCKGSTSSNTTFKTASIGMAIKVPGSPQRALPLITPMMEVSAFILTLDDIILGMRMFVSSM